MPYIAYLDEFGHIGPFIERSHPQHNDSPVFGLAGMVLPSTQVRNFGTWFYQRKCELLEWEIERAAAHPALWEKKGSSPYTTTNVSKYKQLRAFTNRLLNKIRNCEGFVFYVGVKKSYAPEKHSPNNLYRAVLREAIKRLDQFCLDDCNPQNNFLIVMDEHEQRSSFITEAAKAMFNTDDPRRALIEPPFQVESHRYQTLQAADWIAGLIGRLSASWASPDQFPENEVFRRYFEARVNQASRRSGVRREKSS